MKKRPSKTRRFRAATPAQLRDVAEIALDRWYACSQRQWDHVSGGLRWSFRTRSLRDRFVHAFRRQGARNA